MRNIDPHEWEVRCDLAAAYRLIAHFGMDDLIHTPPVGAPGRQGPSLPAQSECLTKSPHRVSSW